MSEVRERLAELRRSGLHRRLRLIEGPQGPRVLLDGAEVLLLCSNNYLGLADHPSVRDAAGEAARRYGAGAGGSRLISGSMAPHRRLEQQPRRLQALPGGAAVRVRVPRQHRGGRGPGRARPGRLLRRSQPRQHHRRLPPLASRDLRLSPRRHRAPRLGAARGRGAGAPDRHRRGLLDGRRRRPARRAVRAREAPPLPARGRRGPRDRRPGPRRARLGRRRRARARGRPDRRHARQGAGQLRRLRLRVARAGRAARQHRSPVHLLHRPTPAVGRRGAGGARAARVAAWPGRTAAAKRRHPARGPGGQRAPDRRVADPDRAGHGRRRPPGDRRSASARSSAGCSRRRSARRRSPRARRGCG